MSQLRSWRRLAGRWWATVPLLRLDQVVTPVVLLDDVRRLTVPPMNTVVVGGGSMPAAVGEFPTTLVVPGRFPIRIQKIRCSRVTSGEWRFGTNEIGVHAYPTPLTNSNFWNQQLAQRPGNYREFVGTLVEEGSTATQLSDDNCGTTGHDQLFECDYVVLPGQYFFLQEIVTNVNSVCDLLQWEEIPVDADDVATSVPRGRSGEG